MFPSREFNLDQGIGRLLVGKRKEVDGLSREDRERYKLTVDQRRRGHARLNCQEGSRIRCDVNSRDVAPDRGIRSPSGMLRPLRAAYR